MQEWSFHPFPILAYYTFLLHAWKSNTDNRVIGILHHSDSLKHTENTFLDAGLPFNVEGIPPHHVLPALFSKLQQGIVFCQIVDPT